MKPKKRILSITVSVLMIFSMLIFGLDQTAFAAKGDDGTEESSAVKAKRTVLMYVCGSDLETYAGLASYNLRQILKSSFSSDEDIKYIIMTGGALRWHLDNDDTDGNENNYLVFPEDVELPDDAVEAEDPDDPYETINLDSRSQISSVYNQIWEARGIDAKINGEPDPDAGKLVLLDGNGISGGPDVAVKSEDELMTDPDVLKAFIDYGVDNYPAEKYDLILWDHGGGPMGGYGGDLHYDFENAMSFAGIVDALSDNKVTDSNDDGKVDSKFDLINFDACLMGSIELAVVLSDYTDYYIASAQTEPGYGQYYGPEAESDGRQYTGWLDVLGNDPEYDTFDIGKIIVDDFYKFYEKETGDGCSQEGTLAVFDTGKMIDYKFMDALTELVYQLVNEAIDPNVDESLKPEGIWFYDELNSYSSSIEYGGKDLFDLGNLAAFLGVVNSEISEKALDEGEFIDWNAYRTVSQDLSELLQSNEFMYMKGTSGIAAPSRYYRAADGEVALGSLPSSGLSIYFPTANDIFMAAEYINTIDSVLKSIPDNDKRRTFLEKYEEAVALYNILLYSGKTVDTIIEDEYGEYGITDKSQVSSELVIREMKDRLWGMAVEPLLDKISPNFNLDEWLQILSTQQIEDAVDTRKITAAKVMRKDGEGCRITVTDAKKRIVKSVERNIIAELPALEAYLDTLPEDDRFMAEEADLSLGSVRGTLHGDLPDDASLEDRIRWYNESSGVWDIDPLEPKWYALNDAGGELHVASIHHIDKDGIYVPAFNMSAPGSEEDKYILLEFSNEDKDGRHELTSIYLNPDGSAVQIMPKDLKERIEIMPILYYKTIFGAYHLPIGKTRFALTADNADEITLGMEDIKKIKDIEDTDGDGEVLSSTVTITDIYDQKIDITDAVDDQTDGELMDIGLARVRPGVYTGSTDALTPEVVCEGETLTKDVDYTLENLSGKVFNEPGDYEITLTGIGRFTGKADAVFHIVLPEEEAAQAVEEARAQVDAAQKAVNELNDDASSDDIRDAYDKLSKAQYALEDAQEVLARSKDLLSEEEQAKLEDELNAAKVRTDLADAVINALALNVKSSDYTKSTFNAFTDALKNAREVLSNDNSAPKDFRAAKTALGKARKGLAEKKANTLKIKGKTVSVKAGTLKKKTVKISRKKAISVAKNKGKVTYSKAGGNKKITISKAGKITIKKGLKKGKYSLKVKVRAAGNDYYKPKTKTVTIRIKVK